MFQDTFAKGEVSIGHKDNDCRIKMGVCLMTDIYCYILCGFMFQDAFAKGEVFIGHKDNGY